MFLFSACVPGYSNYKKQKEAEAIAQEALRDAQEYADEMKKMQEDLLNQAGNLPSLTEGADSKETDAETSGKDSSDDKQADEKEEEKPATDKQGRQYAQVIDGYNPNKLVSYELSDEMLEQIKQKVTKGTKSSFLTSSYPTGIKVGQSHTYAFGMTNMERNEKEFSFEIKFRQGRDINNNPIAGINAETMKKWFEGNNYEYQTLGNYEQAFIPVGITPREEIAPGMPTLVGTYYFELEIQYNEGHYWSKYDSKEFSIKVI